MLATREIRVLRQGIEMARQPLDLFRLPDGAEGVKWGGLVFPVRVGDLIEVSDRGLPPVQCRLWDEGGPGWDFVAGSDGADSYLFVEGSAQVCKRMEQRLTGAGFEVLRSGPNLSGTTGDWFIRLGAIPQDGADRLSSLLGEVASRSSVDDKTPLRERLLVQALVSSQAAQARLRTDLERARDAAVSLSNEASQKRILEDGLEAMSARLAEAEAEAASLQAQLEAAPPAAAAPRATKLEAELSVAAAALLPRLEFLGNSMRFIAIELLDRTILWKALAALDRQERGQPAGWKSLSGHPGWWERHFTTGQDNQGRIYARLSGTPPRWNVLVSHKQDQAMDLRRIGRM